MKVNSVFNRIIATVLSMFIMVGSCFGLSGYESLLSAVKSETNKKQHLCVIYAACQNNPVATSTGLLYETVSKLASTFESTMSIVVADGNPYQAYSRTFSAPGTALRHFPPPS